MRLKSLGFLVKESGDEPRTCARTPPFRQSPDSGFEGSGFGFRVSGFRSWVWVFGVEGLGFRGSGFGHWGLGFGIWALRVGVWDLRSRVCGQGFRGLGAHCGREPAVRRRAFSAL